MLKLWIQSRVDLHRESTPDPILKPISNSKHILPSINLQRVWILQSLNTLDSTKENCPRRDKHIQLLGSYVKKKIIKIGEMHPS